MKKSILCSVLIAGLGNIFDDRMCASQSEEMMTTALKLDHALSVTQSSMEVERKNSEVRCYKRYAGYAAASAGLMVGVILALKVMQVAENKSQEEIGKQVTNALKNYKFEPANGASGTAISKSPEQHVGWMKAGIKKMRDYGFGVVKATADCAMLMLPGMAITKMTEYVEKKFTEPYAAESVMWYVQKQTKIFDLFTDLKAFCVDYDLHASLLNAEIWQLDNQIHVKAFMQDMIGAVAADRDPFYFATMLQEVKKKYLRKSSEMEALQDYVIANVAKQKRALQDADQATVLTSDAQRRESIASMCNLLVHNVEHVAAFVASKSPFMQHKASELIESCNAFVDRMQPLMYASAQELEAYSRANVGMFTLVYEYEKLFKEQVTFLHRYAR